MCRKNCSGIGALSVSQLGSAIFQKNSKRKNISPPENFSGSNRGVLLAGVEICDSTPSPVIPHSPLFEAATGIAIRYQDRADWRRLSAPLVSVVVSVGFAI